MRQSEKARQPKPAADSTYPDAREQLDDSLDLGVVEKIRRGVDVDAHGVDRGLVARVQGRGRICTVGYVAVYGVGLGKISALVTGS